MDLYKVDKSLLSLAHRISIPFARGGFFIVFFWFGILKVLGLSPAEGLVAALFHATFLQNIMTIGFFLVIFGLFEMLIGLLFLFKKVQRLTMVLLLFHMVLTFLPVILLPGLIWQSFLVPTLEGQYIIKNLIIVAAAIFVSLATIHVQKK